MAGILPTSGRWREEMASSCERTTEGPAGGAGGAEEDAVNLELQDKVALITGAGRGIGAAIALELAGEGASVAVLDQPGEEAAAEVAGRIERLGVRAVPLGYDVTDYEGATRAVDQAREALGRLDILVCNAGITRDGTSWKMSEQAWDAVLEVNLKGCFNYCRAAGAVFKAQGSGKIVNISSINGMRGKFGQANYAASKAGIIALSKTLARELGRYGVNVNVVAPGMVLTEMAQQLPREFIDKAVEETVLGRLASPRDVASAVAFLCSESSRHITGEVIRVDGGQYI